MVITPFDEGATNHCVMENRSIVGQVLFDGSTTYSSRPTPEKGKAKAQGGNFMMTDD